MRLELTIQTNNQIIPINYQYFLTSAIYKYLASADKSFSKKLHDGKHVTTSKKFKFFTFSWLQIPKRKIINSYIKILSSHIFWYISSPWDEFIQNLVNGILKLGFIKIEKEKFTITQIKTLDNPFKNCSDILEIKFSCLSPIVVTTKKMYKNKLEKYYYRPHDNQEEISAKIQQNLINKYCLFYNRKPNDKNLKIEFEQRYLTSPKAEVLIHYKEKKLDIEIPAIMCPFTATGSLELIKFGYESGFGELNSAGFGMVKLLQNIPIT